MRSPHTLDRLRDAVRIVELRRVVHHEQAARLEVNMNDRPWFRFRPYGHPARGAKGDQRDRKAVANLVQIVVVRGDTVTAVTIQVEPDGVERHAEAVDHAARRVQKCAGHRGRRRIEPKVAHQPRHIDLPLVHHPPLAPPLHGAA
jgi:hypothetical protein